MSSAVRRFAGRCHPGRWCRERIAPSRGSRVPSRWSSLGRHLGPVEDPRGHAGRGCPAVSVTWIPDCGCDACDSGSQDVLDELDEAILGIVSGAFRRLWSGDREITVVGTERWRASCGPSGPFAVRSRRSWPIRPDGARCRAPRGWRRAERGPGAGGSLRRRAARCTRGVGARGTGARPPPVVCEASDRRVVRQGGRAMRLGWGLRASSPSRASSPLRAFRLRGELRCRRRRLAAEVRAGYVSRRGVRPEGARRLQVVRVPEVRAHRDGGRSRWRRRWCTPATRTRQPRRSSTCPGDRVPGDRVVHPRLVLRRHAVPRLTVT